MFKKTYTYLVNYIDIWSIYIHLPRSLRKHKAMINYKKEFLKRKAEPREIRKKDLEFLKMFFIDL